MGQHFSDYFSSLFSPVIFKLFFSLSMYFFPHKYLSIKQIHVLVFTGSEAQAFNLSFPRAS